MKLLNLFLDSEVIHVKDSIEKIAHITGVSDEWKYGINQIVMIFGICQGMDFEQLQLLSTLSRQISLNTRQR